MASSRSANVSDGVIDDMEAGSRRRQAEPASSLPTAPPTCPSSGDGRSPAVSHWRRRGRAAMRLVAATAAIHGPVPMSRQASALPCPAGRSGPWSRRTGAPEASATGTSDAHEIAHGTGRDTRG